jgi:hypothetical protein
LRVLDLLLNAQIDFLLNLKEELIFFSKEVASCCFDLAFLVDTGDYEIIDAIESGPAESRKFNGKSLEILEEGLAPSNISLVEM